MGDVLYRKTNLMRFDSLDSFSLIFFNAAQSQKLNYPFPMASIPSGETRRDHGPVQLNLRFLNNSRVIKLI